MELTHTDEEYLEEVANARLEIAAEQQATALGVADDARSAAANGENLDLDVIDQPTSVDLDSPGHAHGHRDWSPQRPGRPGGPRR